MGFVGATLVVAGPVTAYSKERMKKSNIKPPARPKKSGERLTN
jgi:hypothetical protein